MPLYEYRCGQCGRLTEKIQKFSDPELTVCPHCGGPLARTLNAPAVHFSGGGWYKDLYSSAKPPANAGDSAAGAANDKAAGDKAASGDKPAGGAPAAESGGAGTGAAPSAPAAAASAATTGSPAAPAASKS